MKNDSVSGVQRCYNSGGAKIVTQGCHNSGGAKIVTQGCHNSGGARIITLRFMYTGEAGDTLNGPPVNGRHFK